MTVKTLENSLIISPLLVHLHVLNCYFSHRREPKSGLIIRQFPNETLYILLHL